MMIKNSARFTTGSVLIGLFIFLGIASWPMNAHGEATKATVRVEKHLKQDPAKIQQGLQRLLQRAYAQHRMLLDWKRKALAAKAKARNKGPMRKASILASATQR